MTRLSEPSASIASTRVAVFHRAELEGGSLTEGERAELARLGLVGERAREWTLGRAAAHRLIGPIDVTSGADGAPSIETGALSISHDGEWFAVAAAERGRVAVDLCEREHARRLSRILARLDIRAGDPCLNWAALECALKLRRLGIWTLLGGRARVEPRGDRATVRGIGADVEVSWRAGAGYVLAWAEEGTSPVAAETVVSGARRGPRSKPGVTTVGADAKERLA